MNTSEQISHLIELLKQDRSALYRQYPDQALYALGDERVVKALETRFQENKTLIGIGSLPPPTLNSSRNYIFFKFGRVDTISPDAVLVVLDRDCKVLEIVAPFDLDRPNPPIAPFQNNSELPFVLVRPSATTELTFKEEEISAKQKLSREFLLNLPVGPGGGGGGGGCAIGAVNSINTESPGYCLKPQVFCDLSDPPYCVVGAPVLVLDEKADDCGLPL